jgi:hypothetical protein
MKLLKISILLLWLLGSTHHAHAHTSGRSQLTEKETSLLYSELKSIRVFGLIATSLLGDAEKLGLNENELTEYAKTLLKRYFGESKYEDICRDSEKFLALVASRDKSIGNMTIRVWVIVDEHPVVYHVKCDAGNFDNPSIWSDEVLGHGSIKTTPQAIKDILSEMIQLLAVTFFKIQGRTL